MKEKTTYSRSRLRFGSRTFFVLTALLAVLFGTWLRLSEVQRQTCLELEKCAGVRLEFGEAPWWVPMLPRVITDKMGDHYKYPVASVEFSSWGMSNKQIHAILPLISRLKSLKRLEIEGAELTGEDFEALSKCKQLKWLHLRSVHCFEIPRSLPPSLQELYLNSVTASPILHGIGALSDLKEIHCLDSDLVDGDIDAVSACSSLEELTITDFDADRLGNLSLENLSKLRNLQVLELSVHGTNLTADAAIPLGRRTKLIKLAIPAHLLSAELAVQLNRVGSIRHLELRGEVSSYELFERVALVKTLRVVGLYFKKPNFTRPMLEQLRSLPDLEYIDASDQEGFSLDGMLALSANPKFQGLAEYDALPSSSIDRELLDLLSGRNPAGTIQPRMSLSGMQEICGHLQPLQNQRGVETMDLSNTDVTDDDLWVIASMTSLKELNLFETRISDRGLRQLANSPLKTLTLNGCKNVTGEGLRSLTQLDVLELDNCPISEAGFAAIGDLASLRTLSVERANLTEEAIKHLSKLNNLISLDLDGCRGNDSVLAGIGDLKSLKTLYLDWTDSAEQTAKSLAGLPRLETLTLSNTDATDESALALARSRSLKDLVLSNTRVGDIGLQALSQFSSLRELLVDGTLIDEKTYAMSRQLLRRCLIDREGSQIELDTRDIRLKLCSAATDDQLIDLLRSYEFNSVDLSNSQVTDRGLAEVAKHSSISYVKARGTKITDVGVERLIQLPRLFHLDISQTSITNVGVQKLLACSGTLRHLDLSKTLIDRKCISTLNQFENLKSVNVSQTMITESELLHEVDLSSIQRIEIESDIFQSRQTLEFLRTGDVSKLDDQTQIGGKLWTREKIQLLENAQLMGLSLSQCDHADLALEVAAKLPNLRWFHLECGVSLDSLRQLAQASRLTNLRIANCTLTNGHLQAISLLPLESLGLYRVDLSQIDWSELRSHRLRILRIDQCPCGVAEFDFQGLPNLLQLTIEETSVEDRIFEALLPLDGLSSLTLNRVGATTPAARQYYQRNLTIPHSFQP